MSTSCPASKWSIPSMQCGIHFKPKSIYRSQFNRRSVTEDQHIKLRHKQRKHASHHGFKETTVFSQDIHWGRNVSRQFHKHHSAHRPIIIHSPTPKSPPAPSPQKTATAPLHLLLPSPLLILPLPPLPIHPLPTHNLLATPVLYLKSALIHPSPHPKARTHPTPNPSPDYTSRGSSHPPPRPLSPPTRSQQRGRPRRAGPSLPTRPSWPTTPR